jgi:hypothetical protein
MTFDFRALALTCTFLLAACGGGGGGGGSGSPNPAPSGPQAVTITETNAKPVAANALDATQSSSTTSAVDGLPIAVQVDAASAPTTPQLIAQVVRLGVNSFAAAGLPAGVVINQSGACSFGGTVSISGRLASSNGLTAGDTLTVSMTNCSEASGTTMSGQLSITVVSGSLTSIPFHIVLSTTATNLSVTSGGVNVVANGTVTLDWSGTTTSDTFNASGAAMTSTRTSGGTSRTTTLRNFTQKQIITGSTVTGSLTGTVETSSTSLGGAVSFTVSTPTPVVWNAATRTTTAGVIKVVGANNSQVLITINADGSVTVQVDANGDGTYEKTLTSTTAELAGLL